MCYLIMEKRIEVFKTNVCNVQDAEQMVVFLSIHFPGCRINFDLHDCDKILRIEGMNVTVDKVTALVSQNGFECSVLM